MLAEGKRKRRKRRLGERKRRIERDREDRKENGQIPDTIGKILGTILGISRIGMERRMGSRVDPWAAVDPVPYLCAVSLKPDCEEFTYPKHVRKGHCTKTEHLGKSGELAHGNRFSILASDDDDNSLDACDVENF